MNRTRNLFKVIYTLEINDYEFLKTKLDDAKIRGLLLGVLANPGRSSNVEELAVSMAIDDSDKKLEAAVFAFQVNFEERALEGVDPLFWLTYLRIQEFLSNCSGQESSRLWPDIKAQSRPGLFVTAKAPWPSNT